MLGGVAGAGLCVLLHIPAGGIVGAVAGSAVVAMRNGGTPALPTRLRTALRTGGLVLLGGAAGVRLEPAILPMLARIAVPLLASVGLLLMLDVLLALLLHRRYQVDPITALFACAPGGVSEIAAVAEEKGARLEIVVAIHVVRVIAVVVVILPLLVTLLGP